MAPGELPRKRRWGARLTVLLVALVAVALAAGLGVAVQDRVHDRRLADARAAAEVTPAVTEAPSELAQADDPLPSATPTPEAPIPDPAALAAALDPVWTAPELGPRVFGAVLDAQTGATLADRGAGTPATPASTTKVLTAATALSVLPPTATFATTVVPGAAPGQIVLIGGGDPTLSGAPAGQPTLYPNAARLSDLAAQVAAATAASGPITSIVVDSGYFTGPTLAPGWDPADAPSSYGAPITATMIDGGRDNQTAPIRSASPDLAAGRALAALLGVPAATVAAGSAPAGSTAPGATPLGRVQSAPLIDLVQQMLTASDNVLADVLAHQAARAVGQPASFAGGVAATTATLAGLGLPGLDPALFTLQDGSGLSVQNRIAPAVLAAILRAAVADPAHVALAPIIGGLPVAAWDGTLRDRYQPHGAPDGTLPASAVAIAAQGVVRAKTGTLTGVSALAGVLRDADGRLLVFVVMAEAAPDPAPDPAERALDSIAGTIAACGCR